MNGLNDKFKMLQGRISKLEMNQLKVHRLKSWREIRNSKYRKDPKKKDHKKYTRHCKKQKQKIWWLLASEEEGRDNGSEAICEDRLAVNFAKLTNDVKW